MLRVALVYLALGIGIAAAQPRITFTGNATFSSKDLRAAIDPFDEHGALVQERLERDLLVLAAYYWDRGYARVRIGEPNVSATEIVIPITENETFTFGVTAVTGDPSARMNARHRDALRVRSGATYSATQIWHDRQHIARYYEERGHAYVDVLPRTRRDLAARTIDLTFEITPGPVMFVEAVNLWCDAVPNAASVLQVFPKDRYDVRKFEGSKAALMAHAGLERRDDVIVSTKRGSAFDLIILNLECM